MLIQTIATVSYLPLVSVLIDSIRRYNSKARIAVLVTDVSAHGLSHVRKAFADKGIELYCCDDLGVGYFSEMRRYYSALEFNSACKVLFLDYQLRVKQEKECLFLDPDIYALSDIENVLSSSFGDILLTPHTLTPPPDDGFPPSDLDFVLCGHINGGVVRMRLSADTLKALEWLVKYVRFEWFVAPEYGLYADQQWLSCLPYYFSSITNVLKDRSINVGYWNLHERHLSEKNGLYCVNGTPAALFHFSGFVLSDKGILTCHSNRKYNEATEAAIRKLVKEYGHKLAGEKERFKHLKGDLCFSQATLKKNMRLAEKIRGRKYVFPYAAPSLLDKIRIRIGKVINCLRGGR